MPLINDNDKLSVRSILDRNLFGPSVRNSSSSKSQSNDEDDNSKITSKKLHSSQFNPNAFKKKVLDMESNTDSSSDSNYGYSATNAFKKKKVDTESLTSKTESITSLNSDPSYDSSVSSASTTKKIDSESFTLETKSERTRSAGGLNSTPRSSYSNSNASTPKKIDSESFSLETKSEAHSERGFNTSNHSTRGFDTSPSYDFSISNASASKIQESDSLVSKSGSFNSFNVSPIYDGSFSNATTSKKTDNASLAFNEELNRSASSGDSYDYLAGIYSKPDRKISLERYNEKLIRNKTESIDYMNEDDSTTSIKSSLRKFYNYKYKPRSNSLQDSTDTQDIYEANNYKVDLNERPKIKKYLSDPSQQQQRRSIDEILDSDNEDKSTSTPNNNSMKTTTISELDMDISDDNNTKENQVNFCLINMNNI